MWLSQPARYPPRYVRLGACGIGHEAQLGGWRGTNFQILASGQAEGRDLPGGERECELTAKVGV